MNEPKHSPLPWRVENKWGDDPGRVVDVEGRFVFGDSCGPSKKNAELIVKAANGYEWFLKALPIVEDYLAERRREYEMWAGREDTGKARAIKAEIAECEGILKAAKGGGIYG